MTSFAPPSSSTKRGLAERASLGLNAAAHARAEAVYMAEQRRFHRLEASLPVWWCEASRLDDDKGAPWNLGFTRNLSLGGAKIVVPPSESGRLRDAREYNAQVLLRFDTSPHDGQADTEYIPGYVRHAVMDNGEFWIGVQYEDGAQEAKLNALRAGLKTVKSRRRWQGVACMIGLVLGLSLLTVGALRGEVVQKNQQMAKLWGQRKKEVYILDRLNKPGLAASRAQGYDTAFQSHAARAKVAKLTQEMKRLSSDGNQVTGEMERETRSAQQGIVINGDLPHSQVQMGVALPYGYAWPQVTGDLEQLLGRDVPYVVLFRDWQSSFPDKDAREARLRAKTLQITWEPWSFSDADAVKMKDIASGKSDAYIDSWAQAAKSFGSEIWLRWGHEFNGNWYPWCLSNNGGNAQAAKLYVTAYQRVVSRFRKAGAWNARFIWCYNAESVPSASWNDPRRAYPGDAYVDAISIDGYNFGSGLAHGEWTSFRNIFAAPYAMATRTWPGKPLMVGETGCSMQGGNKAQWIKDMDVSLRKNFPRLETVVWFEADKEADWRMVSSPASLAASRQVWNRDYYKRGAA